MAPTGKHTLGICDRCGQAYKLHELKRETQNFTQLNNRICPDCFDTDHPQYRVAKLRFWDEVSVPDIRPQDGLNQGYSWRDFRGNVTIPSGIRVSGSGAVSSITVTIS